MKATGIVRRIDDLGRIVIPKEIRERIFGTRNCEGKPMELFMDGDSIVLRKYENAEMRKEQEIRNQAIDEFTERLKDSLVNNYRHLITTDSDGFDWLTTDAVHTHIDEIAEEMRGAE